jgi:methionine-R-sulfoxide reductase
MTPTDHSRLERLRAHGLRGLGMVLVSAAAMAAEVTPTTNHPVRGPVVQVRLLDKQGRPTELIKMEKVIKTDAEWRKQLTLEQYNITRRKGTEPAFCGVFYDHKKPGVYHCVCCDLPLFASEAKFDSGTGWPSFMKPVAEENVATRTDTSHGMIRTEILCARCDAHLGHVFDDGPPPLRKRHCLNSASLTFKERKPDGK